MVSSPYVCSYRRPYPSSIWQSLRLYTRPSESIARRRMTAEPSDGENPGAPVATAADNTGDNHVPLRRGYYRLAAHCPFRVSVLYDTRVGQRPARVFFDHLSAATS
jgi:hypothetical protein